MTPVSHGVVHIETYAPQFACDFCRCLRRPRRRPLSWREYLCDPPYRPNDEPHVKLEMRDFASRGIGTLPSVRLSSNLCRISRTCALGDDVPIVSHTGDISKVATARGISGRVVGDMLRVCPYKPVSSDDVLQDFALDIGCVDISHRLGLIGPDFPASGVYTRYNAAVGYI